MSQMATKDNVLLEGFLKKKSPKAFLGRHVWQERYFVLWNHQLCYYKKKEDAYDEEKCLGFLLVENMSGVIDLKDKENRFNIVLEGVARQFELLGSNDSNTKAWINAIQGALKTYGKKPKALLPASPSNIETSPDAKFWKPKIHQKILNQRRQAISAETVPMHMDLAALAERNYDKTEEEKYILFNAIRRTIAFNIMDDSECKQVVRLMWSVNFNRGQRVINENEPARLFYIIVDGTFSTVTSSYDNQSNLSSPMNNNNVASRPASPGSNICKKGDTFGELALLYDSLSPYTVSSIDDSKCFVIDRGQYKQLIAAASEKKFEQRVTFLRTTALLGQLPDKLLKQIAEALEEKQFKQNETIIRQNEAGDSFYIIQSGKASAERDGNIIHIYEQPGEYFGERALIKNEQRGATITALSDVTVLFLSRQDFVDLMGKMEETIDQGVRKYSILNRELNDITYLTSPTARQNSQGFPKKHIDHTSTTSSSSQQYSASGFMPENQQQQQNIKMHYSEQESKNVIDDVPPPPPLPPNDYDTQPHVPMDMQRRSSNIIITKRAPIKELTDLTIIGTLGRGTFGHVQLVKDRYDNTYALKAVNKCHIIRHNQITHILNERAVMMELNHPFIVKLYGTLKDQNYLYFLLQPSLGGELFSILRARDRFDQDTARFYAAIVVSVFKYMHSLDILYRDLKPENLLMDIDGYLRVTDFGFAKKTKDRTYTFCGTPDYLAPEIVASAGHRTGADWWTLGILIYEMLAGYTPFYDEAGPTSMYSKILAGKVYYPSHFSPAAQDLIASLLQIKPTRRLGELLGGARNVEKHAWFQGFDWNALLKKELTPPIQVSVKNKYDLSNFDAYPEEEMNDEDYVPDPNNPDWDSVF